MSPDLRNMHNWVGRDGQVDVVLGRVFKVLKRGGTFGLVDHRSKSDAEPPGSGGYLREDWVIAKVELASLHFVAKSAINSDPKTRRTTRGASGRFRLPTYSATSTVRSTKPSARATE